MPSKKNALSFSSRLNLALYRLTIGTAAVFRPPRPTLPALKAGSRVLVFSSAGLGDSLLDSVGFRALAETFPGLHIGAVAHHRRPDILRHNPFVSELFLLRKGPPAFLRLWRELRGGGPWDAILYLSCLDPEARCLGYLLGRDATFGLAWRTGMPQTCAFSIDEPGLRRAHLSSQALAVAAALGARTDYPRMVYEVHEADRVALDGRLREWGLPSPGITFQLGGGGAAYRDWPAAHFVELARLLAAAGIGPIFLLGGPDHVAKSREVESALPAGSVFNVTGRLPLPLSAALLERSRCLVSTDTGIMHMGFAVGTPTVALLHCRPGPARVGPLADTDRHELVALEKPPGYRDPSDARMSEIPPGRVFEAVRRLWQKEGA
ncbi:MAG: glycosyltransferase family 9 protein [Terrimicrobiaceae bacterium]|nr:glycosyltransferase family 9 protein [Terrimicrobiaceae bacterium]